MDQVVAGAGDGDSAVDQVLGLRERRVIPVAFQRFGVRNHAEEVRVERDLHRLTVTVEIDGDGDPLQGHLLGESVAGDVRQREPLLGPGTCTNLSIVGLAAETGVLGPTRGTEIATGSIPLTIVRIVISFPLE
jgi:hypothetical protein